MDGGWDLDDLLGVEGSIIRGINLALNKDWALDVVDLSLGLDNGGVDSLGSLEDSWDSNGKMGGWLACGSWWHIRTHSWSDRGAPAWLQQVRAGGRWSLQHPVWLWCKEQGQLAEHKLLGHREQLGQQQHSQDHGLQQDQVLHRCQPRPDQQG